MLLDNNKIDNESCPLDDAQDCSHTSTASISVFTVVRELAAAASAALTPLEIVASTCGMQ